MQTAYLFLDQMQALIGLFHYLCCSSDIDVIYRAIRTRDRFSKLADGTFVLLRSGTNCTICS